MLISILILLFFENMIQRDVDFWYSRSKKNKKKYGWKIIIFCIFIAVFVIFGIKLSPEKMSFEWEKVSIVKWNTIAAFYDKMDRNQIFWLKFYIKRHPEELPNIQEWTYILSWTYTNAEFLAHIAQWPEKEYIAYTVLEWWSIYDIDSDLTKKWYIQEWEYINYVTNSSKISELSERYEFFDSSITSLEWFLYPDTYYLDNRWNLVNQLVSIQLNIFKSKVREYFWNSAFENIQNSYGLSIYDIIKLASIVEKEEKNNGNKATVAGIFYNRLKSNMLLWADITLCYWLSKPYSSCTPDVISKKINDSNNKYNTRVNAWLTPTPIWNPWFETMKAVLYPSQTNYYYYLHDNSGNIHYAETNAEHNQNKNKYL